MNWIYQGNLKCPLTRQSIHTDDLVLDTELQSKIMKWKLSQEFNDSTCFDEDDSEFDATFQDILEITNRIKSVTVGSEGRRQSAPEISTRTVERAEPAKQKSEGSTRRLSDLRLKVLQQRDNRIKTMLSAQENEKAVDSGSEPTGLAQMMVARV